MRLTLKYILLPLLFLFVFSSMAYAQRGVPIHEKPRPDYDPLGIRAGAFTVKPELTLGLEYNDNIYATRRNTESDWITTIAPELDVRSDWTRHALGLNTGLEYGMYASESDENYLDGHIFLDGRLDVLRESFLSGRLGFQRLHEERGEPDADTDWDEPGRYNRTSGDLAYYHGRGKLSVSGGSGFTRLDYRPVDLRDGTTQSQSIRDRWIYNVNARVAYEMHPDVQPFVTTRYEWRRYDRSRAERDSEGYRIGVGTGFDLGGITSGEVFAGYMHQDYDDRRNISGMWYGLNLLWNVTQLTSVEAGVQKLVKETTLEGASGIDSVEANLRMDHELLRNLLVGAFFDYTHDSYQGRNVTDRYYDLGPRITYLWNRNLSAEASYTYREKDSNRSHREYTENRFKVSITGSF